MICSLSVTKLTLVTVSNKVDQQSQTLQTEKEHFDNIIYLPICKFKTIT